MSGEEINYVKDAIQSNWVAPLGPHVDQFEDEIANYVGVNHAAALSYCHAALWFQHRWMRALAKEE